METHAFVTHLHLCGWSYKLRRHPCGYNRPNLPGWVWLIEELDHTMIGQFCVLIHQLEADVFSLNGCIAAQLVTINNIR